MSVDESTVRRIAHLARLAVAEEDIVPLQNELNAILGFLHQLNKEDISSVPVMSSVSSMKMPMRVDRVSDVVPPEELTENAPEVEDNFFVVPKILE